MKQIRLAAAFGAIALLAACGSHQATAPQLTKSGLDPQKFKAEYKGDSTALYTLVNANGAEACITNFGGRLVSMMVPDKNGNFQDVVLGFDSIEAYFPENNLSDFGASIGRYANRINEGKFSLDGTEYQLPLNNGKHSLHGGGELGTLGWQYRVYQAEQPNDSTVVLTLNSADGDNGYPGNMIAQVTYTLLPDNSIDIAYTATTDKPTIVNLTNHSYFNLNGDPSKLITDNELMVNSSKITPIDPTCMTDGTFYDVEGTAFDFRQPRLIGDSINSVGNIQVRNGNGYDHNFVLDTNGDIAVKAAELYSPETGIVLDVYTNEPGIQVYTGNFLNGTVTGKNGQVYNQRAAVCLETQHYPDAPNKPQWPSVRLNPGETYNSHCIYKFSVK